MVRFALDPRAARTRHTDAIALDVGVEITAATMLLQERVEVSARRVTRRV